MKKEEDGGTTSRSTPPSSPPPVLSRSVSLVTEVSFGKADSLMDIITNDEDRYNAFLAYMKNGSLKEGKSTHKVECGEKVKAILTEFGGMKSFSKECQKWIKQQTYPFLSIDVVNPVTSRDSSSTSTSTRKENASLESKPSSSTSHDDGRNPDKDHVETLPPPPTGISSSISQEAASTTSKGDSATTHQPKVKKRMTPNVVSTVVSPQSSTHGNIARILNSEESTSASSQLLSTDNTFVPVKSPSVSHMTPERPEGFNSSGIDGKRNLSVEMRSSLSPPLSSSLLSSSSSSRMSPDTTVESRTITRTLSSSSETFSRFMEPSVSPLLLPKSISSNSTTSSPSSKSVALELCKEESPVLSPEKKDLVKKLAKMYCALVLNNYLNLSTSIPFLAKIASLRMPLGQLVVKVKEPLPSAIIYDTLSYKYFIVLCVRWLCPILCSMGSAISQGFAEAEAVRESGGDLVLTLKTASKSAYERELIDDSKSLSREMFLKPFRDDIDSRHEYKNPLENRAYNERECCFDQFSDLFKRFQSISRSDMNGSKTAEFWAELKRRGAEIIQLGDYNFNWFSELFVAMLLFYGPNMITSDIADVPATINKKKEPTSVTASKDNNNSNNNNNSNKSKGDNNQSKQYSKAQLKHRKLEERLGAGKSYVNHDGSFTRGKHNNGGFGQGNGSSSNAQSHTNGYNTVIEEPAQFFPGHQQYFYRFIVYLDSHRLCEHLATCIVAEIHRLSPFSFSGNSVNSDKDTKNSSGQRSNNDSKNNPRSALSRLSITNNAKGPKESFLHTVVKLKILGKFLGLLHFWPHWTTLTDRSKMGPLLILIDEGAKKRAHSRAPFDLYALIENSVKMSCLSLTVPWILEYLRMMTWDSSFRVSNPHKEAISLLYHMYKLRRVWNYDDGDMPSNRLFVMMELESFVDWIPSSMIIKLPSLPPAPVQTQLNPIDDQNLAFTKGFLRYVLPALYEAWQRLHNKKSVAPSSKQTIDISAPDSGIKPKQLKRQTPQLIKNRVNSNSLTELALSSSQLVSSSSSPSFMAANTSISIHSTSSVPQSPGGNTQTSLISAQSSPSPSVTAGSKQQQSFSFSSPISQSALGYGDTTFNSPNNNNSNNNLSDASSRLVDSFWQQHQQLFQISNFIIELHHSACHERLRDKTRAIIREYWVRAADIKSEIKTLAPVENDLEKLIEKLQNALAADLKHVFNRCLRDGETYLNELLEDRMERILQDLCSLYPCRQRVADLGVELIRNQIKDQHGALLSIFGDYTKRKLDEVLHLSIQQFKKESKQSVETPRKRKVAVGPYPDDWFDNDKLRDLFRRICKSMRISVTRENVEEANVNVTLSAETSCSEWLDAFYKDTCSFTIIEDSTIIEGEEYKSSMKMMNAVGGIAEDMVDIIQIVASKCSKERPLSSTAASNIAAMTVTLLRWTHDVVYYILPYIPDAEGKITVEMSKFFSVASPVLIYLDFMCNERFKASRCILVAEKNDLIFPATIGDILSIAMKRSNLVFFENGKYIDNISVDYLDGTLIFVKGLLKEKGIELNSNDEENFEEGASGEDRGKSILMEDEDWLKDPSILRETRSVLGNEVAEALVVLSNLIQQRGQRRAEQQQNQQEETVEHKQGDAHIFGNVNDGGCNPDATDALSDV